MDQLDLFEGRARRDEGVEQVEENERESWTEDALGMLVTIMPRGAEATSELIRLALGSFGLDPPHSPNCWGALTLAAVRRGLLVDTGRIAQAHDPKSHACRVPVWRRP
jgi:hypothetical protein